MPAWKGELLQIGVLDIAVRLNLGSWDFLLQILLLWLQI